MRVGERPLLPGEERRLEHPHRDAARDEHEEREDEHREAGARRAWLAEVSPRAAPLPVVFERRAVVAGRRRRRPSRRRPGRRRGVGGRTRTAPAGAGVDGALERGLHGAAAATSARGRRPGAGAALRPRAAGRRRGRHRRRAATAARARDGGDAADAGGMQPGVVATSRRSRAEAAAPRAARSGRRARAAPRRCRSRRLALR